MVTTIDEKTVLEEIISRKNILVISCLKLWEDLTYGLKSIQMSFYISHSKISNKSPQTCLPEVRRKKRSQSCNKKIASDLKEMWKVVKSLNQSGGHMVFVVLFFQLFCVKS